MMRRIFIISLFTLILPPIAVAGFDKGEDLLWACAVDIEKTTNPMAPLEKAKCIGYVTGILDGVQMVFGIRPESTLFCTPAGGMSADQQVRIVTKWLEDNPSKLHQTARISVLLAFAQAFPCTE